MEWTNKKIDGDLILQSDLEFYGLVTGNVTVPANRQLKMHGTIAGNLVVEEGGNAHVAGVVAKSVINHGGHVTVDGMVGLVVDTNCDFQTILSIDAKVTGRV
jgi:cytoskeletal protein CcmA (bactofilin family)